MKTFLLLLLTFTLIIPFTVNGQTVTPTPIIAKSFSVKYPAAKNVQWNMQGKDFQVTFNADGFNYETMYSSNGSWMFSQRAIPVSELPAVVKTNLAGSKFSDWQTNSVFVLFYPGMITKYRILVSKDGNTKNLLMSWDGKLLDDNFSI